MSRHTGPNCRFCRREGTKLFLKGERCTLEKCGFERRSYAPASAEKICFDSWRAGWTASSTASALHLRARRLASW
jgi:hypothetical protein